MYVRVTRASYQPTDEIKIQRLVDEKFVPALKTLPGFQHYEGGLDRNASRLVAISTWDTIEHSYAVMAQRAGFEAEGVRFEAPETFEVTTTA